MADQPPPPPPQTFIPPFIQPQTHKGPTTTQVLAVITLFPLGGILLTLAGLTLTGTIIGLALATPLFVIFSPVLVPALIIIGLAVTGFLASGALGLTGFSSLSWILNYVRRIQPFILNKVDQLKRHAQEAAGQAEQKSKELGQGIQSKVQEVGGGAGGAGGQRRRGE